MTTRKDRKTEPTVKELQARVRSLERERDEYREMVGSARRETESLAQVDQNNRRRLQWILESLTQEHAELMAGLERVENRMRSMGWSVPGEEASK